MVNPLTPIKPNFTYQNDAKHYGDQALIWDSRELEITNFSNSNSHSDIHLSILDDSTGEDLSAKCSSQPSLLNDIKNLKIKSTKGRPRKIPDNKENKAFKISGLQDF